MPVARSDRNNNTRGFEYNSRDNSPRRINNRGGGYGRGGGNRPSSSRDWDRINKEAREAHNAGKGDSSMRRDQPRSQGVWSERQSSRDVGARDRSGGRSRSRSRERVRGDDRAPTNNRDRDRAAGGSPRGRDTGGGASPVTATGREQQSVPHHQQQQQHKGDKTIAKNPFDLDRRPAAARRDTRKRPMSGRYPAAAAAASKEATVHSNVATAVGTARRAAEAEARSTSAFEGAAPPAEPAELAGAAAAAAASRGGGDIAVADSGINIPILAGKDILKIPARVLRAVVPEWRLHETGPKTKLCLQFVDSGNVLAGPLPTYAHAGGGPDGTLG